jgi:outer membrane protein assembly factor BamB
MSNNRWQVSLAAAALLLVVIPAAAQDWPMWGLTPQRNMVGPHTLTIPVDFNPGQLVGRSGEVDMTTTRHIKWIAKLGSQTYGNPSVANGRVYVGTNNAYPFDTKYQGDRSIMLCLDEATGKMIWQYNVRKLGGGKVSDWEFLGICSSAAIKDDRVYFVNNLCQIVCLDANGLTSGNLGVTDEAEHYAEKDAPPVELGPTDADVIWRYDMAEELGVFVHNISSNSPMVVGDNVWVATSNGVDWSHVNIPNPRAPALIAVNKHTGELVGEEASGVSERMLHCNWASPAYAEHDSKGLVIWGGGDGFMYAFDPMPVPDDEGFGILKEIWRTDINPPHYRHDSEGNPIKYATREGPSEIISTPVIHDGFVYVAIGQDPEHGTGLGAFSCLKVDTGEIVWQYTDIDRSISTASVHDGLVYVADYAGKVHCLDAVSGEVKWVHDTQAHIWGSTLVADGKVMIGNEDGFFTILAAGPEPKLLAEIEFPAPIYSSPIVANGVLYVATQSHLYAVAAAE